MCKAHVIHKNYTRTYCLPVPVDGKYVVWEKRLVCTIELANLTLISMITSNMVFRWQKMMKFARGIGYY